MGTRLTLAVTLIVLCSCAVPVSHRSFSIPGAGSGHDAEFASSEDLRVAGLVNDAMNYAKQSRFFDAENRLRQADFIVPGNERIEYNLALSMNQTGQSEDAKAVLEKLLSKKPGDPNLLTALADVEFSLGSTADAKARLKSALVRFREAGNLPQAAKLARSISNLAFIEGNEQEALCYSFEAWSLAPLPEQLAWHARLLIAMNYYAQAEDTLKRSIAANKSMAQHGGVQLAMALARFARGTYVTAAESAQMALDLVPTVPELGGEINAASWLIARRAGSQEESEDAEELDTLRKEDTLAYRERGGFEIMTWPPELRADIYALTSDE